MRRRRTLLIFLTVFCLLALAVPLNAPVTQAQADNVDVYGRTLPADAAPYHQQIWQQLCDSTAKESSLASPVTVYARICGADLSDKFSDSLVALDQNLNITPAAADLPTASADGLTWTFKLHPGQVWSDGTPGSSFAYPEYKQLRDNKPCKKKGNCAKRRAAPRWASPAIRTAQRHAS